jgi:hypothetical protein
LAVRLRKPGGAPVADQALLSGGTAPPGSKPRGEANLLVRRLVTVVAVDKDQNTVSFAGPDGIVNTVVVRDPRMQAFIHTLRAGDKVDMEYREAAMVEVVSAK